MAEFDRLPHALRRWLSTADLPWGVRSAKRAYDRALRQTGDAKRAIRVLDELQRKNLLKDAQCIWGTNYRSASQMKEPAIVDT